MEEVTGACEVCGVVVEAGAFEDGVLVGVVEVLCCCCVVDGAADEEVGGVEED
jgi:hypothetical protein